MDAARPVGNIRVGTCGWTEPTLVRSGLFYPPGASSAEARLRFYASVFPLVEVDSTFYSPPSLENARRWTGRTPAGFLFNVKAHGLLTFHPAAPRMLPPDLRGLLAPEDRERERIYDRALPPAAVDALWSLHVDALRPLADAGKLGAVLFQFPFWFTSNRANRRYLEHVADRLPWRVAVEFRGGGWMEPDERARTLSLLERLGLAYVIVDGPQGFSSSTPPVVAQTAPLALMRFLGRNAETWEARTESAAQRFRYLYSREELAPFARAARRLAREAESVHALMNNCYRDQAVRNAVDFRELVVRDAEERPSAPA